MYKKVRFQEVKVSDRQKKRNLPETSTLLFSYEKRTELRTNPLRYNKLFHHLLCLFIISSDQKVGSYPSFTTISSLLAMRIHFK